MSSDTQPSLLVHPDIQAGHSFTNVLLVDCQVTDYQVFVDAANPSTFPIVYSSHSSKSELTALLQAHFTNIERIAVCFLGSAIESNCCLFLDASPFFTKDNQSSVPSGENLDWMISTINTFHVKNVDYLACDTLQNPDWTQYYNLLAQSTGVVVGASDDKTGNLKYGGDWIMESSMEDIETVYFTQNISYYTHLLDGVYNDGATGLTYTYVTAGLTTSVKATSSSSVSGTVTIPASITIDGQAYSVTSLVFGAFSQCFSLTSIVIPNSITSISSSAFSQCSSLTSITIPNSVTSIGSNVFYYCSNLTSVTIPASVTSIGSSVFSQCLNLTSITVDGSNSYYSSIAGVLFNKTQTTLIQYPIGKTETSYTIPASVTSIGSYAFNNCLSLTSVIISDLVTSIGDYAFYFCSNLTSVIIPASVTSIGSGAFYICQALTSITIPNSVTYIGSSAFRSCSNLTSITIPNSVTSIGLGAFADCQSLTSITVDGSNSNYSSDNDGVLFNKTQTTLIQYPAGKTGTSYTIPISVTSIGSDAFSRCLNLTSVIISDSVTSIGSNAFNSCQSLTSITIPNSVTSIGSTVFYICSNLTSVTIPASVTSIGSGAFRFCSNLTSITVDESNSYYSSIAGVLFNKTQTTLIQYPIGKTETSYTIPNSVTSIGNYAFQGCSNLTSITVDESNSYYSSIAGVLFNKNQTTLIQYPLGNPGTSYTIPDSVTSIGSSAFEKCLNLTSITVDGSNSYYSSIAGVLFNKTQTTLIQYPCGKTGSYSIPNSVTSIGSYAFYFCSNLTSVTIPASVTSIGAQAFLNSGLTEATIPATSLGKSNFPSAFGANQTISGKTGVNIIELIPEPAPEPAPPLEHTVITQIENNVPNITDTSVDVIVVDVPVDLLTDGTEFVKSQKRTTFLAKLFTTNVGLASASGKITMTREKLLGTTSSVITKNTMVITKASNTEVAQDTSQLAADEAMYVFMNSGDFTVFSTSAGNLKIVKTSETLYTIYENYLDSNSLIKTMNVGESSSLGTFTYVVGGVSGQINSSSAPAVAPICFPKGTPVNTNQGLVPIEKLNPDIHTIRNKRIVAITQTRPLFTHIVSIEKDALGKNVPSATTQISKEHKVFYKGEMMRAVDLVGVCDRVVEIPYNGETLYNVLMEKHSHMMINNLVCETLHPDNIMAKICGGKYNSSEQDKICEELTNIIKSNNLPAYKKLYAYLK